MNTRKVTSLVLLSSFIPLILSSIVLYLLVPHGGRGAATGWTWLLLDKRQWTDIHINLGLLFLTAGLVHLVYNWRPIVAYIKNKKKNLPKWSFITPAFSLALAINLLFIGGTLLKIPPFSSLLELGRSTRPQITSQQNQQLVKITDVSSPVAGQATSEVWPDDGNDACPNKNKAGWLGHERKTGH